MAAPSTSQTLAAPSDGGPAPERRASAGSAAVNVLKRFLTLREASIIVVTLLTIVYFSVKVDHFFGFENFKNILPYFAPIAILAAGEVFLMINGEIDLSIGGVYLLVPFLFYEIVNGGIPLLPALILSLIIAALFGVVNAFFTAIVGVNSFIVTLGSLLTLEGLALIISHGEQQQTPGTSVTSLSTFASVFGGGRTPSWSGRLRSSACYRSC